MKNRFSCLVLLIVLGLGAYGTYRALFPPRVGGVAFKELAPETQKKRRVEAQKLVEQVEEVARSARKNESKAFTLIATEEQLNTLLQDRLRTENFLIRDLRTGLSPGRLTLQGTADYQGFDVPATLSSQLSARNGKLDFKVESLQLSGLPAPRSLEEKVQKTVGDALQKGFSQNSNVRFETVTTESGQLTIQGRTG